ncbi:hypothetical protein [Streptomyces decoyicus]
MTTTPPRTVLAELAAAFDATREFTEGAWPAGAKRQALARFEQIAARVAAEYGLTVQALAALLADVDSTPEAEAPAVEAVQDQQAQPEALPWPPGVQLVSLVSDRWRDWFGVECTRCTPGVAEQLAGKWEHRNDARITAWGHYDERHRAADEALTVEELAALSALSLSQGQHRVLGWARGGQLEEFDDGSFWAMDVNPSRPDVNKKIAKAGSWACGGPGG